MKDRAEIVHILLNLFSTTRQVGDATLLDLTLQDWDTLVRLAVMHRIAPWIADRLDLDYAAAPIPQTILDQLKSTRLGATHRALAQQRTLVQVHRVLAGHAIPYAVLKGGYLSLQSYPKPGLRPLRDIDILVEKKDALKAYQLLLTHDFSRIAQYDTDLGAAIESKKHLPRILAPGGGSELELHTLMVTQPSDLPADLFTFAAIRSRLITAQVADSPISVPSPTDMLWHIIYHAAIEHKFNNGPLVLLDVHFLIRENPIDWPLFWKLAGERKGAKIYELVLGLVEDFCGPILQDGAGMVKNTAEITAIKHAVSELMLQDFDTRGDVMIAASLDPSGGLFSKLKAVWERLFLNRQQMATLYPVSQNSPKILFYYVKRLLWFLGPRRREYLHSKRDPDHNQNIKNLRDFLNWIDHSVH